MSSFEDLVLAVDLARRDLGAGAQDSWPVVLLRTMTSEQARPRAASFALVCIDRWTRVLPDHLQSELGGDLDEMVEKLVNETVRLPPLSATDATSTPCTHPSSGLRP